MKESILILSLLIMAISGGFLIFKTRGIKNSLVWPALIVIGSYAVTVFTLLFSVFSGVIK